MCPGKTQISLGIRPVWSQSSLSAWRKLGSLATHWAHSEDSEQTGRMPRLSWVFNGRTGHIVGFVVLQLRYKVMKGEYQPECLLRNVKYCLWNVWSLPSPPEINTEIWAASWNTTNVLIKWDIMMLIKCHTCWLVGFLNVLYHSSLRAGTQFVYCVLAGICFYKLCLCKNKENQSIFVAKFD